MCRKKYVQLLLEKNFLNWRIERWMESIWNIIWKVKVKNQYIYFFKTKLLSNSEKFELFRFGRY